MGTRWSPKVSPSLVLLSCSNCQEYHVTQVVQMPWHTLMLSKTNKQLLVEHKSRSQGGRGLLTDQELLAVPHLSIISHLVQAQEFTLYLKKVHTIAVPPLDANRVESVTLLS